MHGVCGKLAWPLVLLLLVVVLSLGSSDDAEGATTYIDGDWHINIDTTLQDGTWVVNGSVYVEYGTLTLIDAELLLNSTTTVPILYVSGDAWMNAYRSTILGGWTGMRVEINGDTLLDNTTLDDFNWYSSSSGITHSGGHLILDHCKVNQTYYAISSSSSLTVRSCEFTWFQQYGVYWGYTSGAPGSRVVVRGSSFTNAWTSFNGYGLYIYGGGASGLENDVLVQDCYFNGLDYGIRTYDFALYGKLSILDNRVENCSASASLSEPGPKVTLSGNHWMAVNSNYALSISTSDQTSPSINNETVTNGSYGIYVSGSYGRLTLRDVRITGVSTGIYSSYVYVDVYDSYVRSSLYDFRVSRGYIHLYRCDHSYSAYVSSSSGEVSEPVVVNVTSVSWQDGTLIKEGYTLFENETGEIMTERDNADPDPVSLATWMMTYRANLTITRVRGMYAKDGLAFRSEPFAIAGLTRMDLVIIDNSTPELTVDFPRPESEFERIQLMFKGNYSERGVGMGSIRATYDGVKWLAASVFQDGKWQLRFDDLPDGVLTFTFNISDKAGNSAEVLVVNITIDTIWPHIDVLLPSKYVTSSPTQLLVQTEPRARAFVNYEEVTVMPDGMFSAIVPLHNNENEVHVRVVDVVGHENYTMLRIVLDPVPPPLLVDGPSPGTWTNQQSIMVTGTTEADASVSVNGIAGEMENGRFSVSAPLDEGINMILVTVTDRAGNQVSESVKVFRDTVAPVLEVLAPGTGTVTGRDRVVVSGRVEDDNVQRVLVNSLSADIVGTSWSREVPLAPGSNDIHVTAMDLAGNIATAQLSVLTDFESPTMVARLKSDATTYIPYDGPVTVRETSIILEVEMSETMSVSIMGASAITAGPGKQTKDILLEPGRNEITVRGADTVGNEAAPITIVVFQDSVDPTLEVHVDDDVVYTSSSTFLVRGATEPGCEVTVGGVPAPVLFNGSFALSVDLREGPNSIRVVAMDPVGNEAIETIQVVYEVEEEDGAMSGWTPVLLGAVLGLVAGLVGALAVTRRRGGGPPPERPTRVEEPEPPAPEPEPLPAPTQEVPGQLPKDPDRDEWEMM